MLFKLAAAVIFTAAGCAAGAAWSYKLSEKRGLCRKINEILRNISIYIRYSELDVYEITARMKAEPECLDFVKRLPVQYEAGENFHELWKNALINEELPDEESAILSELGSVLGTSDREGQLAALKCLEERTSQLEKLRNEAYMQKGRLYRSVGALFGIMAGILVI